MKKLFLIMVLVCFSHALGLWEIRTYAKTQKISGEFIQSIKFPGKAEEVNGEGEYRVNKDNSLFFSVRAPLAKQLKISEDKVFEKDKKGFVYAKIQAPELKILARLMKLDQKWLKKRFVIECKGKKNAWDVILKPLKKYSKEYASIKINGGKYVKKIQIILRNGEQITNEFLNTK